MAERERKGSPPYGGMFISHSRVMDSNDIRRAIRRMAHEILERNHGLENLSIVGLQTGGVPLAGVVVVDPPGVVVPLVEVLAVAGGAGVVLAGPGQFGLRRE